MTWGTIWSEVFSFGPLLYFWNRVNLQWCVNFCCITKWLNIYMCVCVCVCVCVYVCIYKIKSESHSVVSDSLWPHGLYSPWILQARILEWGSLSLLQGIFPTQGLNPGLPHCRRILYQLSHKGSPRVLEWVAYPFSRVSSRPRNWTGVSCIAGGFCTKWVIREAPYVYIELCVYISVYIYTLKKLLFSIMVYHKILNIVSCAVQKDFVVYPLYFNSLDLLTPNSHSIPPTLATTSVFSMSVTLFVS